MIQLVLKGCQRESRKVVFRTARHFCFGSPQIEETINNSVHKDVEKTEQAIDIKQSQISTDLKSSTTAVDLGVYQEIEKQFATIKQQIKEANVDLTSYQLIWIEHKKVKKEEKK
eukprot:TRINITY_DN9463_c0_g1_i2.p1 TRINITY_DN9463_c0_g1~~TRINITY_DN9463_c0_g1_i2.p1  ORF type:complete len:114 (-),score=13.15 TRINITY_DN9463_c0_g1_i2:7-348(-)